MNRQGQAVVLLLLGGAVLKASLTDLYLRYVKEGLRPFLIAAALMLVAAAVMTLWYDLRPAAAATLAPDQPETEHPHTGPGHPRAEPGPGHPRAEPGHSRPEPEHSHREPRVAWLLILPVLGLLLVAPPALGSYAAGQAGTALGSQQVSDFPPLPGGDPAKISVLDYASRAVFDKGLSIGSRRVQLTGFVLTGPEGEPYLARMILSCCAADARPIKIGMTGNVPAGLPADTWVEVVGTYTARTISDTVNGETIPFLTVAEWREVPPPKRQYEG
ncbi:MAG TPA: TIGR03943 family protein [Micromonosporaceae bacterium]|nr:TIGR03943 family protein [Micromonosporaceae bacterium]